jgi:hypothetical protein
VPENNSDFQLSITIGDASFQATGEAELVMQALAEFKTLAETATPLKRQRSAKEKTSADDTSDGGDGAGDTSQPLPVFVKRNWPSQSAKATAIVMWARDNDNKASLAPSEVEDYWRKTPGKVPTNPPAVCKGGQKQGWLHNEGKGHYSLTGHGEDMVKATPTQA